MMEAYLKKPAMFVDATGVPSGKYTQGTIKSVSDKGRLFYVTTTGRAADYSGRANGYKSVQCDVDTGRLWLVDQPKQFDEFRGGYFVSLPPGLVGQRIYMRSDVSRSRRIESTWLVEWFPVSLYEDVRKRLKAELQQREEECATPSYSVEIIERSETQPVCDPVLKQFVSGCRESTTVVFKGNDLAAMKELLDEFWPSTWNREIVIRGLNDSQPCSCLPWSPSTPLRRVDKLLV